MLEALQQELGNKVSLNPTILEAHGHDENATMGQPPLAVVFAETTSDVLATLAWARSTHTPVIALSCPRVQPSAWISPG